MSNRKKSREGIDVLLPGQLGALPRLSILQAAKRSAKPAGRLFSANFARRVAILPDKPPASEVRTFLNSAANVIECATGGHGRCANSGCRCRCHEFRLKAF